MLLGVVNTTVDSGQGHKMNWFQGETTDPREHEWVGVSSSEGGCYPHPSSNVFSLVYRTIVFMASTFLKVCREGLTLSCEKLVLLSDQSPQHVIGEGYNIENLSW